MRNDKKQHISRRVKNQRYRTKGSPPKGERGDNMLQQESSSFFRGDGQRRTAGGRLGKMNVEERRGEPTIGSEG